MSDKRTPTTLPSQSSLLTQRYMQLQDWLQQMNQDSRHSLTKLAGDASFRCYYRLVNDQGSFVVMDAPPDKESCQPFVSVAELLQSAGVLVPNIFHQDLQRGFLLLSDLGDRLYLSELNTNTADRLYQRAFNTLLAIARIPTHTNSRLPQYDEARLLSEMQLFPHWYLAKYKKFAIDRKAQQQLQQVFTMLIDNAQAQPQVCVHRDYHSRNLLICAEDKVGVLDFQDALQGPITYDLVSLLKDCYIDWPQAQIDRWVESYYLQLSELNYLKNISLEQFTRWFDFMGLQRHLKCLGIFVRLHVRDQKPNYLNDIPRVITYVRSVCDKYQELTPLLAFLERE